MATTPLKDDYAPYEPLPDGLRSPMRCAVCGGPASVWRYTKEPGDPFTVAVMCDQGERIGPQSGITNEGCPLYMPPDDFYRATCREAIAFWDEFSVSLVALLAKNAGVP